MKCKVCGYEYTEPSLGGEDNICPSCECGIHPSLYIRAAKKMKELLVNLEAAKAELEDERAAAQHYESLVLPEERIASKLIAALEAAKEKIILLNVMLRQCWEVKPNEILTQQQQATLAAIKEQMDKEEEQGK